MGARIVALVVKELLALLRDRAARVVLIVPPLLQLMVFGYAASFDLNHIPYAVYNEDGGAASRQLLARFEGAATFRQVATVHHDGEIAPLIDAARCCWCCTWARISPATCCAASRRRCRSSSTGAIPTPPRSP